MTDAFATDEFEILQQKCIQKIWFQNKTSYDTIKYCDVKNIRYKTSGRYIN